MAYVLIIIGCIIFAWLITYAFKLDQDGTLLGKKLKSPKIRKEIYEKRQEEETY